MHASRGFYIFNESQISVRACRLIIDARKGQFSHRVIRKKEPNKLFACPL